MTQDEIIEMAKQANAGMFALLDAHEAKLKEKNTDAGLKTGVGKPGDFV